MRHPVLVDTGPLVAFLDRRDRYHEWVKGELSSIAPPLLTCEPVLGEGWHLLGRLAGGRDALLSLLSRKVIALAFDLGAEVAAVRQLASRYESVPMSLADACLVRMAELYSDSTVLTLDGDFVIYRKHGRQVIRVIQPPAR